MKALDKVRDIAETLKLSGIESAEREAEIIITQYLGIDRIILYNDNPEIKNDQASAIDATVDRRINHEPLQYILGTVDFLGLKLVVGPGVLIPRPETELMAEYAVGRLRGERSEVRGQQSAVELKILDICTGSGCLALALAKEFPTAEVIGVDISEKALSYAKKNAVLNDITNSTFLPGDLFNALTSPLHHYSDFFDLIISNPPYIKSSDICTLQPDIRDWEPVYALDGGPDGLAFYRAIIPAAVPFLKHGGALMMELGIDCADAVRDMLGKSGYSHIDIMRDYAGIERVLFARKQKSFISSSPSCHP